MSNVPLQQRAGKNYDPFLGLIESFGFDQAKLNSNELVVLEGTDDLKDVIIGESIPFFGVSGSGFTIQNLTGAPIDAALYFEDKYGSSIKVDEDTAIPDDGTSGLAFSAAIVLAEGDKLVLRITGNVTAQDGVILTRSATKLLPSIFERQAVNEKITQSSFRYKGVPGVNPAAALLGVANMSSSDVNDVSITVHLPDGSSYTESYGSILAGETAQIPLLGVGGIETEVVIDSLPADGYLYGAILVVAPTNGYQVQPPLNE